MFAAVLFMWLRDWKYQATQEASFTVLMVLRGVKPIFGNGRVLA